MACPLSLRLAQVPALTFQAWMYAKLTVVFSYFPDTAKVRHESGFWTLTWTVLAIAAGAGYFATYLFANRAATNIRAKYQKQCFLSILCQKIVFFDEDDHSQGTMTARSSTDPRQLEEMLGGPTGPKRLRQRIDSPNSLMVTSWILVPTECKNALARSGRMTNRHAATVVVSRVGELGAGVDSEEGAPSCSSGRDSVLAMAAVIGSSRFENQPRS